MGGQPVNACAARRAANGLAVRSVRTGAYYQARQRLPLAMMTALTHHSPTKRVVCCLPARSHTGAGAVERSSWPMAPPFRCQIRRRTRRVTRSRDPIPGRRISTGQAQRNHLFVDRRAANDGRCAGKGHGELGSIRKQNSQRSTRGAGRWACPAKDTSSRSVKIRPSSKDSNVVAW